MNSAADEIEDKIRQIRIENQNLLSQKEKLQAELASLWEQKWVANVLHFETWDDPSHSKKRKVMFYWFIFLVFFLKNDRFLKIK